MAYHISDFLPFYPGIKNEDFNIGIKSKYEFRTPPIEQNENFPSGKGDLFAHQVLISKLMSSHTPYNGILLMHEMGTGKTCSASAIIQQVRSENNGITNFIYVTISMKNFGGNAQSMITRQLRTLVRSAFKNLHMTVSSKNTQIKSLPIP
jgi:chromosomal replication initiation ATPase DnaA